MMSQHGRLVNVKSPSSQNHSADDNLTRKSDSAPTAYFDILDIFKGEAKVNVNVTVYTNVSGLLKVNIGEYLREKIFLQAHVTRHWPPYYIFNEIFILALSLSQAWLDTESYCATLAHKTNHSFTPNCQWNDFFHPRCTIEPELRRFSEKFPWTKHLKSLSADLAS